jgi:hypothetical protein
MVEATTGRQLEKRKQSVPDSRGCNYEAKKCSMASSRCDRCEASVSGKHGGPWRWSVAGEVPLTLQGSHLSPCTSRLTPADSITSQPPTSISPPASPRLASCISCYCACLLPRSQGRGRCCLSAARTACLIFFLHFGTHSAINYSPAPLNSTTLGGPMRSVVCPPSAVSPWSSRLVAP